MTTAAIIVAAGRGQRMLRETPKQYLDLAGIPVLRHTVRTFLADPGIAHILVVIHPDDRPLYDAALEGLTDARLMPPVHGGSLRATSVRNGLEALADVSPDHVLIHDAARPFCPLSVISAVLAELSDADGAFAALPVVDALWRVDRGEAQESVPRHALWRAQTPQGFRYQAIVEAHLTQEGDPLDDVQVAKQAGLTVNVVLGDETNFKITTPEDMARAEQWLAKT
ncbi:MAG: 2-C-methyl-D-erythritol 4-phosphate cytidylyltransferase [Silicimonas sp.]|nr:2-C-methyl-D-erythritol 4-phosphate cytidylyltransferase [Silicimonas sp.]